MRKAERLFQILTLLRGRRTVITAKDLAERLQVSERTVYWDQSAPYSRELRAAIKSQSVLELSYRREDRAASVRHIWPLGLVYWGRTWTLVAWCELREAYRMFRLDRIVALAILERHFTTSSTLSLQHYLALQTKRCEEQA